jgi:[ribosomal protein S5]-alanine N-acetyltransferase
MITEISKNIFKNFLEFESGRLKFRQITLDDSKEIFSIRSNDDVMKYMDVPRHYSVSDSEKLLRSIEDSFKKGKGINWAIIKKDFNAFIGYIGFIRIFSEHCRAEIGYALKPDYWGKVFPGSGSVTTAWYD